MKIAAVSPNARQPIRSWFVVLLLLAAATAGGFLLDQHVSLTSQAMLYVLAVVIASYTLRWLPSVVCAVSAVTAFNFFFVPPRWTFEVDSREHLIALFTMLLVALVISHLAAALRRETEAAHRNEERARQLQALATELSGAATPQEVLARGQSALEAAFEGPCVLALRRPGGELDLTPELASSLGEGMQCCMREAAVLGPGTGRWPGLNAWYLPLGDKVRIDGVACIQNVAASDTEGREHAQALCALLAQTLWRLDLSASMLAAQQEAQRQQVQSTFLAAISHDLRTPLAAIVGAASSLQTQGDKLGAAEQRRLLGSIVNEAAYLSTVTENTLQLVQLANSPQELKRDWESMEEIVGSVLARVRQRDPARRIKSSVPHGLPLIKADPVLLAQLIANLLDNALKYSLDAIELVVNASANAMQVSVKDRGAEIPAEKYQSIFEPYCRNDQSGQGGAGLGLALCRAIAGAHDGSLTLRRRARGGNSFTFSLPVDLLQPESESP
jgi:two-component system, OmpR family, sensor histidine kinase KdpD